jgi:hypothetical protein
LGRAEVAKRKWVGSRLYRTYRKNKQAREKAQRQATAAFEREQKRLARELESRRGAGSVRRSGSAGLMNDKADRRLSASQDNTGALCSHFVDGSDGTRTRDLRRDSPAVAPGGLRGARSLSGL